MRHPRRLSARGAWTFLVPVVLLLAGCGDLTGSAEVEVVAEDFLAALQFGGELPSLGAALSRWGRALPLDASREGWKASWELPHAAGRPLRIEAVRGAAPILADRMSVRDLRSLIESFERAVRGVEGISGELYPAGLVPALEEARELRVRMENARNAGDRAGALEALLLGSDALREVTPSVLASELLACMAGGDRRIEALDPYSEVAEVAEVADRKRRLEAGARMALEENAPVLALRRAWYAFRLHEDLSSGGPEALSIASRCADRESFD